MLYKHRSADLIKLSRDLEELATTDALTGLPNRLWLNKEIADAVDEALLLDRKIALLVLDMDGFKKINDTLGHTIGDEALSEVATRLKRVCTSNTTVARLGGDEFCIVIRDVADREHAAELGM